MASFDGALNSAKKIFDTAADKTGEAFGLSKLYVRKTQIKSRVQSIYGRLGKATYNTHREINDEKVLMNNLMAELDRQLELLRQTEQEIQDSSSFNCPICGKKNGAKAQACKFCGSQFNHENITPTETDTAIDADYIEE